MVLRLVFGRVIPARPNLHMGVHRRLKRPGLHHTTRQSQVAAINNHLIAVWAAFLLVVVSPSLRRIWASFRGDANSPATLPVVVHVLVLAPLYGIFPDAMLHPDRVIIWMVLSSGCMTSR